MTLEKYMQDLQERFGTTMIEALKLIEILVYILGAFGIVLVVFGRNEYD
jgi:hypothetical protein